MGGGGIETITFPPVDQFSIQADRFSEAIRGLGTVPVSLEDAIGNMAVIDAFSGQPSPVSGSDRNNCN